MTSKKLKITIAICTYNRGEYLHDTLSDLSNQTAPKECFEIVVVNNNSSDGTEFVCETFQKTHEDINFVWVNEPEQGLSFARNRAAREAKAPMLVYIDDDVKLPENFVETALNYVVKRSSVQCAGGRIWVQFEEENTDWIPDELMPMFGLHNLGDEDKRYPAGNFPRGGNMMISKNILEAFGYFDTTLGRTGKQLLGSEEKAFFERVRRNGVELHYWSDLELTHRIGSSRLENDYLEKQSVGIGQSERLRLNHSRSEILKKAGSEIVKFAGSLFLSLGYLVRGRKKAAFFILQFRIWVMKGFFATPGNSVS